MTTKNGFIPNSFQTPNLFVDKVMPLLTAPEFVVLMFMARHILGWEDVQNRCTHLSLTAIEKGHRGQSGCGLGRSAIQAALTRLEEFGLLHRKGQPSSRKGQLWELTLDEEKVQWPALETRREKTFSAQQRRTRTARKKKAAKPSTDELSVCGTDQPNGMSDNTTPDTTGLSHIPVIGLSDNTMSGLSDRPIETHSETQGKEKITAAPTGGEPSLSPPDETALKPPTPQQQLFENICHAWGWDTRSLTPSVREHVGRVASELMAAHAPPERMRDFKGWLDKRAERDNWKSYTLSAFSKYWPDFAAVLAAEEERQRTHKPKPIPTLDDKMEKANYIRWLHANGRADEANKVTYDDIRQLKAAGAFPLSAQLS